MMNEKSNENGKGDRGPYRSAADLMLGYCRGEREAFDGLYSRVAPLLSRELLAWTGDRRRAEELLQRTFLVLHDNRAAYVKGADPGPWIIALARREFRVDCRQFCDEGQRPFWSRVRALFARVAFQGEVR